MSKEKITVSVTVNENIQSVWDKFTQGQHMCQWNFASDDWHCPKAEIDLKVGGKVMATMAAKDGSFSFDFTGVYTEVIPLKKVSYILDDGRVVETSFEQLNGQVHVIEVFEAEDQNPSDMQRAGWQMILDNFKKYCEN